MSAPSPSLLPSPSPDKNFWQREMHMPASMPSSMPAPKMSKLPKITIPKLDTSTKFSIWFTIALVIIIALLIVLILSSNVIRSNTNNTENYIMKKMEEFNSITGNLAYQYNLNKGVNISDNSYTSPSGTVYYGPKSANSTIGTGAAIQANASS
jgi:hypothetical protein